MQENFINGARAIIKTAMAYTVTQNDEFNAANVKVDTKGRPGYVVNPVTVNDRDGNGAGTLAGPDGKGIGENGKPVTQASYEVTNQRFFAAEGKYTTQPFVPLAAADIAGPHGADTLDLVDTLVLADITVPADAKGRPVDKAAYLRQPEGLGPARRQPRAHRPRPARPAGAGRHAGRLGHGRQRLPAVRERHRLRPIRW